MTETERRLQLTFAGALGLSVEPSLLETTGGVRLQSAYPVSDLAVAAVASAGLALSALSESLGWQARAVRVDRARAEEWFESPIRPIGWRLPPVWDPLSGDYATSDGWIRIHTNAPKHRDAALRALAVPAERDAVARAVAKLSAEMVESTVVAAGGAAAELHSPAAWAEHPQGRRVAAEPLVHRERATMASRHPATGWRPALHRPLVGIRVLDLTRVLAGPTATQVLAGWGADVLRVDSPDWDEPGVAPLVQSGKRSTRLDLRSHRGMDRLRDLLSAADVLVVGYRRDALADAGLDAAERATIRPGLVEAALVAYGWTGPWADRRGFDTLVQMSSGIAQGDGDGSAPRPLPVQALDYATGWLTAAAVLRGLALRVADGRGSTWRLSLARTAVELERARHGASERVTAPRSAAVTTDRIRTGWGDAHRVRPPVEMAGAPLRWDRGPGPLGAERAEW